MIEFYKAKYNSLGQVFGDSAGRPGSDIPFQTSTPAVTVFLLLG